MAPSARRRRSPRSARAESRRGRRTGAPAPARAPRPRRRRSPATRSPRARARAARARGRTPRPPSPAPARRCRCRAPATPRARASRASSAAVTNLPQRACGTPCRGAELVEQRRPAHAEARLERPGRVVEAGVNDAAVVRAGVHPGQAVPLDEAHGSPRGRDLARAGEPGDARPDHHDVDIGHGHQPRRITRARFAA